MFKKNLILFFFLFSVAYLNAQQLSSSSQQKVDAKIEALSTASTNTDWSEEIRLNKEIADIYQKNRLYSQAIPYFKKAHQISKTNKQSVLQRRMAISLSMIGIQLGNFSEALNYTIEVNEISKNIGLSKKNIYDEIITIGYLYRKTNNYQKSYETLKEIESKVLFEAYDEKLVDRFYREIAAVCKANGDTKNYLKYTNILEKRHINKTEAEFNQKTAGFVETVHEQNKKIENIEQVVLKQGQTLQSYQDSLIKAATAKRESDYKLQIQNKNLIIKQNELEQEKLFSRTLTFGLIFLLVIIGVVSYLTILIKKSNTQIKKSKQEIETQNTELEQKNEQISKKNEQISSGIRYAKNIQIATLLPIEYLKKAFPTFILYKAKDIVSGDFYWHAIKNDKTTGAKLYFSAVVDCTGHGVPGAFMSLIGVRLLNEILFEKGIEDPAKILERLNSELQIALRQSETENDDGMDISLARIEKKNGEFEINYCGANRPIIYFENEKSKLNYVRGNLATIGGVEGQRFNEEFTNTKLVLQKNDMIYLTSDGYVDQNNPQRKKFGSNRLLKLLENIAQKDIEEQESALKDELSKHRSDSSQRDDITIMGIRLQ